MLWARAPQLRIPTVSRQCRDCQADMRGKARETTGDKLMLAKHAVDVWTLSELQSQLQATVYTSQFAVPEVTIQVPKYMTHEFMIPT